VTVSAARWRRRAEARPDEILDAALDVFVAEGFDAARMEDVARRAGLSKAGVYLYFDGKEALLKALIAREVAPVAARAAAMAEAGAADPEGALRAIAAFVGGQLANPRIFAVPRLVLSIANRFPDIADLYRREVIDRARAALAALVEAGVARGVFRDVDPEVAVRLIIGPIMAETMLRHVFGVTDAAREPQALIDATLAALKSGAA
jgi:AcrR family transcriptional regulator